MRLVGSVYIALMAGLSDEQRSRINAALVDLADNTAGSHGEAEMLRVIAMSAADRELHGDCLPLH
jgi:hypothetical protein